MAIIIIVVVVAVVKCHCIVVACTA